MVNEKAAKEACIISTAIIDFYFNQMKLSNWSALPCKPRDTTNEQIKQLRHFAKQGVKVRLK